MAALKGQATNEQIDKLKEAHPAGVYYIASATDIAYFREPTRHDVGRAISMSSDEKPLEAIEEFGRLTFVGGSKAILDDDQMFLAARKELNKHWGGVQVTSGNL